MALATNINDLLNKQKIESNRIEFKKGWNPGSIYHSICAFANDFDDLGGGYIIVGVDIGATRVSAVVGEVNNFEQIETICSTSYKCSGIKKAKIINEEEIVLSLAKTIKDAENETNLKINSAYTTIPGKYVTIVQNSITKEVKDKFQE